jgi:hypothetical protein
MFENTSPGGGRYQPMSLMGKNMKREERKRDNGKRKNRGKNGKLKIKR